MAFTLSLAPHLRLLSPADMLVWLNTLLLLKDYISIELKTRTITMFSLYGRSRKVVVVYIQTELTFIQVLEKGQALLIQNVDELINEGILQKAESFRLWLTFELAYLRLNNLLI